MLPMTTEQKIAGALFVTALATLAAGHYKAGGVLLVCWLVAGLAC